VPEKFSAEMEFQEIDSWSTVQLHAETTAARHHRRRRRLRRRLRGDLSGSGAAASRLCSAPEPGAADPRFDVLRRPGWGRFY
jgi:hypothetical protein